MPLRARALHHLKVEKWDGWVNNGSLCTVSFIQGPWELIHDQPFAFLCIPYNSSPQTLDSRQRHASRRLPNSPAIAYRNSRLWEWLISYVALVAERAEASCRPDWLTSGSNFEPQPFPSG